MSNAFGNWLAGFIDGEGCFIINKERGGAYRCSFYLKVRDDDREIIDEIAIQTGIGRVYNVRKRTGHQAQVCWQIQTRASCIALSSILTTYPLRGKKSRDFSLWANAVDEWLSVKPGTRRGKGNGRGSTRPIENEAIFARMATLRQTMIATRAYPETGRR